MKLASKLKTLSDSTSELRTAVSSQADRTRHSEWMIPADWQPKQRLLKVFILVRNTCKTQVVWKIWSRTNWEKIGYLKEKIETKLPTWYCNIPGWKTRAKARGRRRSCRKFSAAPSEKMYLKMSLWKKLKIIFKPLFLVFYLGNELLGLNAEFLVRQMTVIQRAVKCSDRGLKIKDFFLSF